MIFTRSTALLDASKLVSFLRSKTQAARVAFPTLSLQRLPSSFPRAGLWWADVIIEISRIHRLIFIFFFYQWQGLQADGKSAMSSSYF